MRVVFAQLNHFHHVIVKRWRLKLAVGFFTQVENRQTCSEVLIIRCFAGDQIRRRFDDGFVDIRRFDAVVELMWERSSTWEIDTLFSPSAAQSRTRWILSRLIRSVVPSRFVTSRL
jgi:hypothetical protein